MKWFWGTFLVFIGILLLGENFNWWQAIDWGAILQYWPILLIVIGVSILFKPYRWGWAVMLTVAILAILILADAISNNPKLSWNKQTSEDTATNSFSEEFSSETESAVYDIKTGAAKVIIDNATDKLIEGTYSNGFGGFDCTASLMDNKANIKILTDKNTDIFHRWSNRNLNLKLNKKVPLEISLDSGASNLNLDLTQLIISKIDISAGASNIDLKIGDKIQNGANINIGAGASNIKILTPKDLGVNIKFEAGMSTRKLNDYKEIGTNNFQSINYSDAKTKINLAIKAGLSTIEVTNY